MISINEWDANHPFFGQFGEPCSPVTLIIQFNVPAEVEGQFLDAWRAHGLCMQPFPGYLGEQLHKGLAGSNVYVNYSTWNSVAEFAAAFSSPASQECVKAYPDTASLSGQLLQKVAVANVCKGR